MEEFKEKLVSNIQFVWKHVIKKVVVILMPAILITFAIIFAFSFICYLVNILDGSYSEGNSGNTPYVVSASIKNSVSIDNIIETSDGYKFNVDLNQMVDDIITILEENNGVLNTYISEKNQKEYLKAFIRAELITKYPDLRNAGKIGTEVAEDEIQGCIEIHRALSNGGSEILTFVDYDTFMEYIDSNSEEATHHFTLDSNCNLIFASWIRVTTNVTSNVSDVENVVNSVEYTVIASTPIDYQSILEQYSMPFDFLWALTVVGEDEDFAYEVAQLALDSKIILTVKDNLTTTETEILEEYEVQEKIYKEAWISATYWYDSIDDYATSTKQVEIDKEYDPVYYYIDTITKTEYCASSITVTYANTWLMEYTNIITNEISDTITNQDIIEEEDTEYELVESGTLSSDSDMSSALYNYKVEKCGGSVKYLEQLALDRVSGEVGTINYEKYSRTINQKTTNTVTTTYNKYTDGTPTIIEKTDKDSTEPNFVTLFLKYGSAKTKLISARLWLYAILEESPTAADMVDMVKYLFYKATGTSYGVTELDAFSELTFRLATKSGKIQYNSLDLTDEDFEYICRIVSAERGDGTQEQREYVASVILNRVLSTSFPNTVFGVISARGEFSSYMNSTYLSDAYLDATTQAAAKNVIENGDTTGGAVYFMTPEAASKQTWIQNCIYLFNDEYDSAPVSGGAGWSNTHNFYTTEAIQDELSQYKGANGNIILACIEAMEELLAAGVHYAGNSVKGATNNGYYVASGGIVNSWNLALNPSNNYGVVCATYVSYVIYKAELLEADFINRYNYHYTGTISGGGVNTMLSDAGWTHVSEDMAQEGDVCVYDGHTFIYAGGNEIYDQSCGVVGSNGSAPSGGAKALWTYYKNKESLDVWRQP